MQHICHERLEFFNKYILPWIVYVFTCLSLAVPALVIGILSSDDKCINNSGMIPGYVWLVVYACVIILLNITFAPMIYLFVKLDLKTGVTKRYITSGIVSLFIVGFLIAWSGIGVHLYRQIAECSYKHASRLILGSSIIWLSLTGLAVLFAVLGGILLLFNM